jgi:hypothetical protein
VRAANILVAVLGASNYTFARFSEAWIGAHVDALSFLGGVLKALVAGQRLQRPKVRLFFGSVVPKCPEEHHTATPISGGLMERGCIWGPALPQRAGPGLNPNPPLRGRDHFLCGSWHFLRWLRNGGELSANARVVSAMLQHRTGCLVAEVVDLSRRSLTAPAQYGLGVDVDERFHTPLRTNMPVHPGTTRPGMVLGRGRELDQNQKRRQLQSAAFLASHDPCLNRLEWIPAQCRARAGAQLN